MTTGAVSGQVEPADARRPRSANSAARLLERLQQVRTDLAGHRHRRDPDEVLEVGAQRGQEPGDGGANIGRGVGHGA